MNLSDALAALRALKLPEQRKRHLAALMLGADRAELARIVHAATAEAERNRAATDAWFSAELAARADWARRQAEDAAKAAVSPVQPSKSRALPSELAESWTPAHRPIVVTWTEPRKPDVVREEVRPEQADGNETNRAQRFECPPEHRHGLSPTCYSAHKCRCAACREAEAGRKRAKLARKREQATAAKPKPEREIPHGTMSGYTHHKCRCQPCREAAMDSQRRWRAKKKLENSTGP